MRNRAELARRAGRVGDVGRERAGAAEAAPEIQAWVRGLPPGTPKRFVTERALRGLARLPLGLQVGAARNRFRTGDLGAPAHAHRRSARLERG